MFFDYIIGVYIWLSEFGFDFGSEIHRRVHFAIAADYILSVDSVELQKVVGYDRELYIIAYLFSDLEVEHACHGISLSVVKLGVVIARYQFLRPFDSRGVPGMIGEIFVVISYGVDAEHRAVKR